MNFYYRLSAISDDLIRIDRSITQQPDFDDRHVSIMEATEETRIDRWNQIQYLAEQSTTEDQALAKKERQRRKNMKLKLKQRTKRPEFQNKIKRPIYHRYDFKEIRAQLLDGNVHTKHC